MLMRNIITKVIALVLISIAIVGCKSAEYSDYKSDKTSVSSGFNDENYIWEGWIFPSNKTTGK